MTRALIGETEPSRQTILEGSSPGVSSFPSGWFGVEQLKVKSKPPFLINSLRGSAPHLLPMDDREGGLFCRGQMEPISGQGQKRWRTALMNIRNLRFYQTMQFVLDLLAVSVAWICTIQTRVLLNPLATRWVSWSAASIWAPSLMMILALWIVMAWRLRFYHIEGPIRLWNNVVNAAEGALLASGIIVVVTFFSRELGTGVSRSFFIIFAPLVLVSLGLARCVSVLAAMLAERHWPSPIRAALLGDRSRAGQLISLMNSANVANVIKGLILPEGHTTEGTPFPMPILGTTSQLAEVINRERLNRIILLNGSISSGELDACNKVFKRMSVIVNCTVDFAPELGRVDVVNQYGLSLVELRPLTFARGQETVKRVFASWLPRRL